jgi:predicted NBD/HSP70 family sugar kinase
VSHLAGIGPDGLRRANLSAMLTRVHLSGPTSRAALTAELGLNRSTIGALSARLESRGLVRSSVPPARDRTGRPSHVLTARADVAVLAVSLDVDWLSVALVGLGGRILARRDRRHERGGHAVGAVVESVALLCEELLCEELLGEEIRCLGVGASLPGVIRADDGQVRFAPNLGWVDEPFTELLAARLGRPVRSGNNADLGAMAEHLRGAAMGVRDVVFLSGGVGIGGGFLLAGQPLRGSGGYGGEVGHLPVDPVAGELCRCGSRGCWETKIGENHLLRSVGRLPGGGPEAVAEIIAGAAAGDPLTRPAVAQVAFWVGVGLGAIVNLCNPSVIVVNGVLAAVWKALPELVLTALSGASLAAPRAQVEIRVSGLGNDSSLIGAAELAFEPLLADPAAYALG